MSNIEPNAIFKISLFGDGGVGKTSLTRRYLTGFFEMDTKITMGASIHIKKLQLEGYKISLQIWDFGGEEQFRFLLPAYAAGASGGIYMFDISRYASMKKIYEWLELFQKGVENEVKEIPILMVGGKKDLENKRSVSARDAEQFAKANNCMGYIECSSATGENVGVVFEEITLKMLQDSGLI